MMWTKEYSGIAIVFSILVLSIHILFFFEYTMPSFILLAGLGIVFLFFISLWYYTKYWKDISSFTKKLFFHSIIYRVLGIVFLYTLSMFYDPESLPFEISAIDSVNYDASGKLVTDAIEKGDSVFKTLSTFWKGKSDYGFSIIIGILYYVFGKFPLIIKIFNVLIGSFSVIRIYQITKYVYGEERARLASIIMMIMPPLIWFGAMVLKETFLIFVILNIGYFVIKLVYGARVKLWILAFIVLQIGITLYFRTVLAPLLLICVLLQIIFLKTQKKHYRIVSVFISVSLMYATYFVVDQLGMKENVDAIVAASQNQFENELTHAASSRGISYTTAIVAPLLIAGAIVTPFPSLLDFEEAQLGIFAHFQNEIIRNCLYFFVFFGLYQAFKNRRKGSIFIISFAIGYILILAISGISFQDRFQILALPFLLIFMADGIYTDSPKKIKYWTIYLVFIFIAILMWNLFKLSNRGLL